MSARRVFSEVVRSSAAYSKLIASTYEALDKVVSEVTHPDTVKKAAGYLQNRLIEPVFASAAEARGQVIEGTLSVMAGKAKVAMAPVKVARSMTNFGLKRFWV